MNLQVDVERVCLAHRIVCSDLLAERAPNGHWPGETSSSPLATAAAISALVLSHRRGTKAQLRILDSSHSEQNLAQIVQHDLSELLLDSVHWLARQQNTDGGWGDSDRGASTLAATLVALSAFRLTGVPARYADLVARAEDYVDQHGGVVRLRRKYDAGRSLATGVLVSMALADLISWRQVPALAFELACRPTLRFRRRPPSVPPHLLPAFLAIGHAKFFHNPPRNPLTRILRRSLATNCHSAIEYLQADDGGFVNSALQTAIVVMCVASCDEQDHPVVQRGVEFLLSSVRSDASWSVERDQSVWATTLALNCLVRAPNRLQLHSQVFNPPAAVSLIERERRAAVERAQPGSTDARRITLRDQASHSVQPPQTSPVASSLNDWVNEPLINEMLLKWLLNCQQDCSGLHGETSTGGWRRSDSPGSLPDVLVTANVLLALANTYCRAPDSCREPINHSVGLGIRWLTAVQSADGGWPTMHGQRDTTKVGQSGVESTALALQALAAWYYRFHVAPSHRDLLNADEFKPDLVQTIERGSVYLAGQQRADGSFPSQWFGNRHHPGQDNPVTATAQLLVTYADLGRLDTEMAVRAARWLATAQHATGGWGPPRAPLDYSGSYKVGQRAWRSNDELAKYCSMEETAMAVDALLPLVDSSPSVARAVAKGLDWMTHAVEQDAHQCGSVLSFNFAGLWYYERLSPLAYSASALSNVVRQISAKELTSGPVAMNADR